MYGIKKGSEENEGKIDKSELVEECEGLKIKSEDKKLKNMVGMLGKDLN